MQQTQISIQEPKKRQRISLQEIWRLGCAGEPLHPQDNAHFTQLARSRFHTFLLGMQHVEDGSTDAALLVKGMASELNNHPGLETQWRQYNFADSTTGKQVTEKLESAQQPATNVATSRSRQFRALISSFFSRDQNRSQ